MQARVSVIIPTLNAGRQLERQLEMLNKQTVRPDEILVVDSQSADNTTEIARTGGARVLDVERSAFDHGGTRDMALHQTTGDIVIFMTQDALPMDERMIEHLIAPLEDPDVAASVGRQIAYDDAYPYEKAVRAHNYPDEELVWGSEDIAQLGVRAFRISDVCAAYRRTAYLESGGFDHPILTNEDMLIAEKLLRGGHKLAYTAAASVYHSHNFTLAQEYRRNYIIGRTMKRYEARFHYISEMGAGTKLVKAVMIDLLRDRQIVSCFAFALNCAARLIGNRMGRWKEAKESRN